MMDRLGKKFLTGAAFTGYEDRELVGGCPEGFFLQRFYGLT